MTSQMVMVSVYRGKIAQSFSWLFMITAENVRFDTSVSRPFCLQGLQASTCSENIFRDPDRISEAPTLCKSSTSAFQQRLPPRAGRINGKVDF